MEVLQVPARQSWWQVLPIESRNKSVSVSEPCFSDTPSEMLSAEADRMLIMKGSEKPLIGSVAAIAVSVRG